MFGKNKPMIWEHKVVESKNHMTFSDDANKLGDEGWELVHVAIVFDGAVIVGYFKRPKLDE